MFAAKSIVISISLHSLCLFHMQSIYASHEELQVFVLAYIMYAPVV